jgi:hypothetical protein
MAKSIIEETTEIEELKFYDYDEIQTFVWLAGFLILAEIGLRNTVYRSFIWFFPQPVGEQADWI